MRADEQSESGPVTDENKQEIKNQYRDLPHPAVTSIE